MNQYHSALGGVIDKSEKGTQPLPASEMYLCRLRDQASAGKFKQVHKGCQALKPAATE